jgi:choice-of-anchor B domain-containing protein
MRYLTACAALLAMLALSCGGAPGADPTSPSSLASPAAPAAEAGQGLVLRAHLDLATLMAASRVPSTVALPAPTGTPSAAGCWGYTSPDGRRLALVGTSQGTAIAEVTQPAQSRAIAFVEGAESQWREIKTYGHYAYVTTEARNFGLDIIDLASPDQPRRVATWTDGIDSAHTLWIDTQRALLFANGARSGAETLDLQRIFDLEPDPERPRLVGHFGSARDNAQYVHDAYARGTTLYGSAIYDGSLVIYDARRPDAVQEITRFHTGGRFTHNSWLTDDGRYLFTTDERANQPVEGWDIADPFHPRKVSEYIAAPNTIPHNVMIDGTRLVLSHYTEGVHLLDISNPEKPVLLGSYDTDPAHSGPSFSGDWGAYIFPGTNLIIASDIEGGLFVVEYVGRR